MSTSKTAVQAASTKISKKTTQLNAVLEIQAAGGQLDATKIHHKTIEGLKNLEVVADCKVKTDGFRVAGVKLTALGKKVAAELSSGKAKKAA